MSKIQVLSNETIDRIAAGEVVERPLNVIKELVENAIDAGATIIHAQIRGGGSDYIRVTDNGSGIASDEVKTAFLRHATSKLRSVEDFDSLMTMGFRGEALSSICAVSKTEMITKTADSLLGTRIAVNGGKLSDFTEVGAPNGTTIIVRDLFYNTPARKKFLKSATSEGALVEEMMERFALSHPEISFEFTLNNKLKIQTSGNGSLKDCIYRIYGKDIWQRLLEVSYEDSAIKISGFCCKPEYSSAVRTDETCFVNSRYVKSKILFMAIEEGYQGFLMQHRFPFCVLNIDTAPYFLDVNVHPQKLEVRFSDNELVLNAVKTAIHSALSKPELIVHTSLDEIKQPMDEADDNSIINAIVNSPNKDDLKNTIIKNIIEEDQDFPDDTNNFVNYKSDDSKSLVKESYEPYESNYREKVEAKMDYPSFEQENLFEQRLIDDAPLKEYTIVGQIFDTYWLITLNENLYIVDQHAAHEKVNYERFLFDFENSSEVTSQMLMPAQSLHLTAREAMVLNSNMEIFEKIGFEIEYFGENSFAIRAVPQNLFGLSVDELFREVLNELLDKEYVNNPDVILQKLASMSCKAAVKGNNRLSYEEMKVLMKELMTLKNPYHCPHGRPVFILITKNDLEKKFKRIV